MEGELGATRWQDTWRASATSSWPTTRAATSRAPARSTTRSLFGHIDALGYNGWIGCEYKPADRHRGRPGLARHDAEPPERRRTQHEHDHRTARSASSASASWARPWPATCSRPATAVRAHAQQGAAASSPTAARRVCASAQRGRAAGRHHLRDGARHARRGDGAVRRGRRGRRPVQGQDGGRHELDLADRDQGLRGEDQRARLRLPRRAGLRRRSRRQGRQPDHHGRRRRRRPSSASSRCSS